MDLCAITCAGPAKTFSVADILPVCRFINGSQEMLRVHKGLQQHQKMAKGVLPISGKSLLAQRQYARTQIRDMPVRKDQKTAVVGHKFQTIILMTRAPADPLVPCSALPGCSGEADKGNPLVTPNGNVPKSFADLGQITQIMMCLHQFLIVPLFESSNRPDLNLP